MVEQIEFELVSPEKLLFSEMVDMVTIPGGEGDYGVMFGHQPMITNVRPGIIEIDQSNRALLKFYVDGGFAEVTGKSCSVMTEEAINIEELNQANIEQKIKDIESNKNQVISDIENFYRESRLITLREILKNLS
tara:strand:+ start:779 stop:1180 length:402 start_codon:yes stop_codon:yes gene_type:complete